MGKKGGRFLVFFIFKKQQLEFWLELKKIK